MANTVTYANALASIRDFAVDNGFNNDEVVKKINKLIEQKTKTKTNNGKSDARKMNEDIAKDVAKVATENDVDKITNKWVRDNFPVLPDGKNNNAARATAILNAGVDLELLERHIVAKSATRNELYYTVK